MLHYCKILCTPNTRLPLFYHKKKVAKAVCSLFITLACVTTFSLNAQPPEASLNNRVIKAKFYLPDPDSGYYRGSRFDWSGVIPSLTFDGHEYFGQWFPKYDPRLHDAVMGPVDDFLPVGYMDAKPGEPFLKIGIGILERKDEKKYSIGVPYEIRNAGDWTVKRKKNQLAFMHLLADSLWAYNYTKTVSLVRNKPDLVIAHRLQNTGSTIIETTVYNHNFFMLDHETTGPNIVTSFPFQLTDTNAVQEAGFTKGKEIHFAKVFSRGNHLQFIGLQGYTASASDYDITIKNTNTGAGVHITSDKPLTKLNFWAASTTVCPEPFTAINLKPGEVFEWKIFYHFYSTKPPAK